MEAEEDPYGLQAEAKKLRREARLALVIGFVSAIAVSYLVEGADAGLGRFLAFILCVGFGAVYAGICDLRADNCLSESRQREWFGRTALCLVANPIGGQRRTLGGARR